MPLDAAPATGHRLELAATDEARAALRALGRTEDVKFSPDNRRLAVAGFVANKIVVFDVDVSVSAVRKHVTLSNPIEITSSSLRQPHGLAFIDDAVIVVANRAGEAPLLRLPPRGSGVRTVAVRPLQTLRSDRADRLKTPGSVAVSRLAGGLVEVLICNNYAHYVTRHVLEDREPFATRSNAILLDRGLNLPDGVTASRDRRWIAVSNHKTHRVLLYENKPGLDRRSKPVGILRNLNFPHGLRFARDDAFLLVADAGDPCVNVYAREGESWAGTRDPVCSFAVMDDTTYRSGRFNPEEGGPKGIDIDRDMNILVATCEKQPLAFFDLDDILAQREAPADWRRKAIRRRMDSTVANFGHLVRRIRNVRAGAQVPGRVRAR